MEHELALWYCYATKINRELIKNNFSHKDWTMDELKEFLIVLDGGRTFLLINFPVLSKVLSINDIWDHVIPITDPSITVTPRFYSQKDDDLSHSLSEH